MYTDSIDACPFAVLQRRWGLFYLNLMESESPFCCTWSLGRPMRRSITTILCSCRLLRIQIRRYIKPEVCTSSFSCEKDERNLYCLFVHIFCCVRFTLPIAIIKKIARSRVARLEPPVTMFGFIQQPWSKAQPVVIRFRLSYKSVVFHFF